MTHPTGLPRPAFIANHEFAEALDNAYAAEKAAKADNTDPSGVGAALSDIAAAHREGNTK